MKSRIFDQIVIMKIKENVLFNDIWTKDLTDLTENPDIWLKASEL